MYDLDVMMYEHMIMIAHICNIHKKQAYKAKVKDNIGYFRVVLITDDKHYVTFVYPMSAWNEFNICEVSSDFYDALFRSHIPTNIIAIKKLMLHEVIEVDMTDFPREDFDKIFKDMDSV